MKSSSGIALLYDQIGIFKAFIEELHYSYTRFSQHYADKEGYRNINQQVEQVFYIALRIYACDRFTHCVDAVSEGQIGKNAAEKFGENFRRECTARAGNLKYKNNYARAFPITLNVIVSE